MVRYFLANLLLIISCAFIGQFTGDISQKNNVDKVTLDDFDLFAKNSGQKADAQEDIDTLEFIVSAYQSPPHLKALPNYAVAGLSLLVTQHRYSIQTRAPPHSISA